MTDELKACPFCGSGDVSVNTLSAVAYVACNVCSATGPFSCRSGDGEESSVETSAAWAWNDRAEEEELVRFMADFFHNCTTEISFPKRVEGNEAEIVEYFHRGIEGWKGAVLLVGDKVE